MVINFNLVMVHVGVHNIMRMIFLLKFSVLEMDSVTNLRMDSEDLLSGLAFGYHEKDISLQPTNNWYCWMMNFAILPCFILNLNLQ